MQKYIVQTSYERIRPMDDVLVPRRRLLVRGVARAPRIASLLVVGLMLFISIAGVESHSTISYFTDAEQAIANSFVADPIFFSVVASTTAQTFHGAEINTDTPVVIATVPGVGSDPMQYYVEIEKTGGNDALCNALTVLGDAPLAFDGLLASLQTATTSTMGPQNFFVSLPDDAGVVSGDTCAVDVVYKGWNDGVREGNGYTDTHRVSLVFDYQYAPIIEVPLAALSETPVTDDSASSTPDILDPVPEEGDAVSEPATEEETATDSGAIEEINTPEPTEVTESADATSEDISTLEDVVSEAVSEPPPPETRAE